MDFIDKIIEHEGGFVNDPFDSGGATKFGITRATLSASRGYECSAIHVEQLTLKEAKEIYKREYYANIRAYMLPAFIQYSVVDFGVNAGPKTAILILQRVLCALGKKVQIDAYIGGETASACDRVNQATLVEAYCAERISYYLSLGQTRFINGWVNRASKVRDDFYDQH